MQIIQIILKYFWFIATSLNLLNTFWTKSRLVKHLGQQNDEEKVVLNKFIKWYRICFTIPFLLLGLFQLLGGYNTPFYIFMFEFKSIFYILGFLSLVLFWGLIVYLVVVKNGADLIAKYNRGFKNAPDDPKSIKFMICGLMIFIAIFVVIFFHFMKDELIQFEKIMGK
jgi:hypothetical protein